MATLVMFAEWLQVFSQGRFYKYLSESLIIIDWSLFGVRFSCCSSITFRSGAGATSRAPWCPAHGSALPSLHSRSIEILQHTPVESASFERATELFHESSGDADAIIGFGGGKAL
ncbi:MAG TPA: hypothetical protein VIT18_00175, partial [Terrimicrobiaceae bacterium]